MCCCFPQFMGCMELEGGTGKVPNCTSVIGLRPAPVAGGATFGQSPQPVQASEFRTACARLKVYHIVITGVSSS